MPERSDEIIGRVEALGPGVTGFTIGDRVGAPWVAAAHLLAQLTIANGQSVFAFTTPGDDTAQALARALGCRWAGGSDQAPPVTLDAAIIFAPVGELVSKALGAVRKGGTVVCGRARALTSFDQETVLVSACSAGTADAVQTFSGNSHI